MRKLRFFGNEKLNLWETRKWLLDWKNESWQGWIKINLKVDKFNKNTKRFFFNSFLEYSQGKKN